MLKLKHKTLWPLLLSSLSWASTYPSSSLRIVIDPGHGGSDFGTVYNGGAQILSEKEITLLLAKETAEQLRIGGEDVILTRTSDVEVPLSVRTSLANKLHADVFLSIHMNSTRPRRQNTAEGFETYILNNTTDASSKRLAHLENKILSPQTEDSPPLDVALILKDLRLDANLSESKRLACSLQSHLLNSVTHFKRPKNRGVKQALFHVLLGADMPSVLVEAGFLNSAKDRSLVLSREGRRSIGRAIAQAVHYFKIKKNTPRSLLELSSCKIN